MFSPRAVGMNKLRVGKFPLRVLVEHFQVCMGGGAIEIVIELFAILAMIALAISQAKQALLENRIAFVPENNARLRA